VNDGYAEDEASEDEAAFDFVGGDIVPPARVNEPLLQLAASSAGIARSALVARIIAAIVSALERTFPGIQFDANYDPVTGWFEPLALVEAGASDVAWMRERGVDAEIGDQLAFRLTPTDIGQATDRWHALDLGVVVSTCECAIGWVLADCFAPDWLASVACLA